MLQNSKQELFVTQNAFGTQNGSEEEKSLM